MRQLRRPFMASPKIEPPEPSTFGTPLLPLEFFSLDPEAELDDTTKS